MAYIVTANIKSNPIMAQGKVLSDVAKVRTLGDVLLWQEIGPARYKDAVRQLLSVGWIHTNMERETPISLNGKYWEVLDSGNVLTHYGRKFTSPSRYISWVVARRRGTNRVVVFMNSHFVSGAFNPKYKFTTQQWRRQMWDHHYEVMKEMVTRFVALGYTVIGGGDWNRTSVAKFAPNQRWLAQGGIDHLFVVEAPNGVSLDLREMREVPGLNTDHKPRVVHTLLHTTGVFVTPKGTPSFTDLPKPIK